MNLYKSSKKGTLQEVPRSTLKSIINDDTVNKIESVNPTPTFK